MAVLFALAVLLGFSPVAPFAPHQTLSFVLNADNASAQRLPRYRAAAPIVVRVGGNTAKYDAITVTASGPDGTTIRAPLARSGEDFTGALRLATPGAWTVGVITELGSVSNAVAGVPLNVEAADGTELVGDAALAFAVVCTVAGIVILLRRDVFAAAIGRLRAR